MKKVSDVCKYVIEIFEEKGWTGKQLVIWFVIGWVFQLMAGFGLLIFLIANAVIHYEQRRQNASNNDEESNQSNAGRRWSNSGRNLQSGVCENSQTGNRTRIRQYS